MDLISLILNAGGGAIIGPILSKLLGGKGATGVLAGVVGGVAGGYGMDAAGLSLLGGSEVMGYVNEVLQGGIGGGVIGGLLGVLSRSR
ncbi:MAG: hypothetical protein AAGA24_07275 [Pseudomonadota bacterium]